jgi:hypothetical protein
MPYQKTDWSITSKKFPRLPIPPIAEQLKIKRSLNIERNEPFPRCRGKMQKKVKEFEKKGDFSHSGTPRTHLCNDCRCKRVSGWGTTHYGVGYCWYHDVDSARSFSKSQAVALRQGYPLDPIHYKSDSEYIDDVRRQASDSGNVLSLRDDLVLLRTHLQEFEQFWREADPAKQLRMKTAHGAAPMTDDVKVACLTKLVNSVSRLSRDQFVITESDYIAVDEVKTWFWAIIQALERNCRKLVAEEIDKKDFLPAMMRDLREIPMPKTGKRKT